MEPGVRDLETHSATAAIELHRWLHLAELLVPKSSSVAAVPHVRLLAAPALLLGGDVVLALERKDAALLALLAVDGPVSRARVAALLWPDAESPNARNSLRQRLFRLRRAVGSDVIEEDAALRLADSVGHDLADLPGRLAKDPSAAAGELLGSFGYEDMGELAEWVQSARERFRALRRDAIAAAAAHEESNGHVARALAYAERLLAEDPLSEKAHRLAMRLHYRRGDRSAALGCFRALSPSAQERAGDRPERRDA